MRCYFTVVYSLGLRLQEALHLKAFTFIVARVIKIDLFHYPSQRLPISGVTGPLIAIRHGSFRPKGETTNSRPQRIIR
jgi:hypothetical protein